LLREPAVVAEADIGALCVVVTARAGAAQYRRGCAAAPRLGRATRGEQ
jgi:hypothetical protein